MQKDFYIDFLLFEIGLLNNVLSKQEHQEI